MAPVSVDVDGVSPQGNTLVFPGLKLDRVPLTCRYPRGFTFYVAYPSAPFLIQPVVEFVERRPESAA